MAVCQWQLLQIIFVTIRVMNFHRLVSASCSCTSSYIVAYMGLRLPQPVVLSNFGNVQYLEWGTFRNQVTSLNGSGWLLDIKPVKKKWNINFWYRKLVIIVNSDIYYFKKLISGIWLLLSYGRYYLKKKIYTERTLQFHRIFLIQVEQKIVYNQNQIKHTNMSTRFFLFWSAAMAVIAWLYLI